jgi:hypothetical protein
MHPLSPLGRGQGEGSAVDTPACLYYSVIRHRGVEQPGSSLGS